MSRSIEPPAPKRPESESYAHLTSRLRRTLLCSRTTPLLPLFLCLLASVPAKAQDIEHPASGLPIPRSRLTPKDVDLAIRIASNGSVSFGSPVAAASPSSVRRSPTENTVLSRVEMAVGNKDESGSLFALVTTYNYERHETSSRLIDLTQESIVWERIANDGSAPLAPVETDEARRLALEDPRVRGLLGSFLDGVELEFLHPTITDAGHRLFGKRVALVLFKTENGYIADLPAVFANLTDAEVVLEL